MPAGDALSGAQFPMETRDMEGRVGDRQHITRRQTGWIPTSAIANMPGVKGEVPGEHRNKRGADWEKFKGDIAKNGIKKPVFITMDHGEEPKMSEGNHRRDAAVELGMTHVPFEATFFGHAERHHQGWS